jgi:hypothetical protein
VRRSPQHERLDAATVARVEVASPLRTLARTPAPLDVESREWLRSFRDTAPSATRLPCACTPYFCAQRASKSRGIGRRLSHLRGGELQDIATEAAEEN